MILRYSYTVYRIVSLIYLDGSFMTLHQLKIYIIQLLIIVIIITLKPLTLIILYN